MKRIVHRRKFMALTGAVASGGILGMMRNPDAIIPDYSMDRINVDVDFIEGDTVTYPSDSIDASVSDDDYTIELENPEAKFELQTYDETDPSDDERLRVSRDLSGDEPAAWMVPVYHDNGEFVYHVLANEAFVESGQFGFIRYTLSSRHDLRPIQWEQTDDVYHDAVLFSPNFPLAVVNKEVMRDPDADVDVRGLTISEDRSPAEVKHREGRTRGI